MASLKELKGRINSVKSTQKITKAKQMVAAAKLRRAQAAAEAARPYAERMAGVMANLAGNIAASDNLPRLLAGTGADKRHLLVVVNTDKGLCGGLNSNIVRAALLKARALVSEGKVVQFYLVGKKGRAPIKRAFPDDVLAQFDTSEVRNPGYVEAGQIVAELVELFDAGRFDIAHLFYARFKSALLQEPTEHQIIPVPPPTAGSAGSNAAIEYEPDEEVLLAALLPRYLQTQIFGALLEISASEQGASMNAMDNATRNAGDLINRLTILYNRSRQAAITTQLIEIIAGAEAQ